MDLTELKKVAKNEQERGPAGYGDGAFWRLNLPSTILALIERVERGEAFIKKVAATKKDAEGGGLEYDADAALDTIIEHARQLRDHDLRAALSQDKGEDCDGNKAFYDAEIAPLLMKAGRVAQERGLPLVATVEYEPGEFGTTATLPADHSHAMAMNLMAVRAAGDFDALAFGMAKRVRHAGCGHGSIVLKQMGVPTEPTVSGRALLSATPGDGDE